MFWREGDELNGGRSDALAGRGGGVEGGPDDAGDCAEPGPGYTGGGVDRSGAAGTGL